MAPAPFALPALHPPSDGRTYSWPAPNYVNPETRGWAAPACIIALTIITFGVFCARIWARFWMTGKAGLDDWLIIASMPVLLGQTVATVLALRVYGFQLHAYDQTPKTNITVRQITLAMETIYLGTTTLTKISILLFYRRLSMSVSRWLLVAIWASIIFVAANGITFIFVIVFTCTPVEAYWYRFSTVWLKTHSWKCHDELTPLIVVISICTLQDFIACILPMFIVRKLNLPLRQKLGLMAIFLTGLLTCAVGCLRVQYAYQVFHHVKANVPNYDITWSALGSWVSTSAEINLAVICASAPALKVYFKCLSVSADGRWDYGSGTGSLVSSIKSSLRSSIQIFFVCCKRGEKGARPATIVGEPQQMPQPMERIGVLPSPGMSEEEVRGTDFEREGKFSGLTGTENIEVERLDSASGISRPKG